MEVTIKSRVCMTYNNVIYETDSKMEYLTIKCDRFYNDIDLSALSPYLKIKYGDGSCNVCNMSFLEIGEQEITFEMPIDKNLTCMAGDVECQPMLKLEDGTQVFNCSVFVLSIKPSVRAYEYIDKNTPPSAIENLVSKSVFELEKESLNNKIVTIKQNINCIQNELDATENNYFVTIYAIEAEKAKSYTKGGEIDKKFKEIFKRISLLENK